MVKTHEQACSEMYAADQYYTTLANIDDLLSVAVCNYQDVISHVEKMYIPELIGFASI